MGKKLYIGNIRSYAADEHLSVLFGRFGFVENSHVLLVGNGPATGLGMYKET